MKQRFLQGAAYSGAGMVYSTLALLVAGKLLTNTLPTAQVGEFALLLLCAECLGMIANLGLPATLPKLLQSRDAAGRQNVLAGLFAVQGFSAALVAGACAIAASTGSYWLPLVSSWLPLPHSLLALLPVLLVVVAFRDFLLAGAAGLHAYGLRAGAIATMATLQAIFFAALFFGSLEGPLPFAASNLFATAAGTALLARAVIAPGKPDWGLAREQVRFSAPLFANNILNFIYQRVDTLLVVHFLGLETAAIFEMAKRIPGVVSRFFGAVLVPYLPSVSELLREGNLSRAGELLQRASAYTAFAGYVMTLTTVAAAAPVLHLLFNRDYTSATPALGPLLIAACLAVQAGIMGQALIALERPRWIMYINLGLALISILLNLLLVPRFGLAGAGWSAAAAALFSYALQWIAVARTGIDVRAGRGLLVHVFFAAAYGVPVAMGGSMPAALAAILLFCACCVWADVISVRELKSLLQRDTE